jgi:hypothetical protein
MKDLPIGSTPTLLPSFSVRRWGQLSPNLLGGAKGLFWGGRPIGLALIDTLRYLADKGILETRDYGEYRWSRPHNNNSTAGITAK